MSYINKIINEQRERIAELQQENTLLLAKTLPECNCEGLQQRIAELESKLDKACNDLANFEGYPEEVSALRHDIERRKQRYVNILHKKMEWKKRAEAAERERDELAYCINFIKWFVTVNSESKDDALSRLKNIINEDQAKSNELMSKFAIEQQIKELNSLVNATKPCGKFGAMHVSDSEINRRLQKLYQQLNGGERWGQ